MATAQENQQEINQRIAAINRTVQAVINRPGVEPELFEAATRHLAEAQDYQQQLNTIWTPISQQKRQNEAVTDFDRLHEPTKALMIQANDLHAQAMGAETLSAKAASLMQVNREEMKAAQKHHRQEARLMLTGMLLLVAAGIFVAFLIMSTIQEAASSQWDSKLTLLTITRTAIFAGIAWLVAFVGRLHARHAQQGVSYTDRMVAVDVSSLSLAYAAPSKRDETLFLLVEAFTSSETNAFRHSQHTESKGGTPIRQIAEEIEPLVKQAAQVAAAIKK